MSDDKKASKGQPQAPTRKPIEEWAREKGTAAWLFAGAKAGEGWAVGAELTESEYTAAIAKAASITLR